MIDNKDFRHKDNFIELKKSKYFLIGFIVGITPFILILSIMILKQGGIEHIPSIFRNTLIIAGIITSIINSFVLKNMVSIRLMNFYK